jgi:hypothetical protein
MIQGFLLDRVDAKAARTTPGRQDDFVIGATANETQAPLLVT